EVLLLIGHLGDKVVEFVGDGSRFNLSVRYLRDGELAKGTGGAVRDALSLLGEQFYVMYGDSYLECPFRPLFQICRDTGCLASMAVLRNRNRWDQSNVIFDGRKVLLHDKSSSGQGGVEWIDYGITFFKRRAFERCPKLVRFDLSCITSDLAKSGELAGLEVQRRFYEIGTPGGLREIELYLSNLRS